ncbi:MAG TPA: LuxR C-terminal-related transcriptional regulator [Anaerolineae bacterium]|nr:LuxR C-terminal-related transcriptional regulator [Anaerolineae bacterium]
MNDEPFENKELSEREIEVVRLLAAGLSNKEIAGQLFLSVNTVKVHLRNIFTKLAVQSRTEATLVAIQRGWVVVAQLTPAEAQPAEAMLYAPLDLPKIVVEPPLPLARRVALVLAVIVCAAGVLLSGLRPANGVAASGDVFSDRPIDSSPAQLTSQETAWSMAASMPTARTRLAVAAHGGRLVAIGGDTQNGATGAVEWFDPKENTWTAGASKPTAVSNVSAVVLDDQIYVPGGMTSAGVPTTVVEVYRVEDDTWSAAAALPAPRMAYAASAFDGQVYVFGGWDGVAYSASVYAYTPETNEWKSHAPMPTARGFAAAAVLGDAIYIVGGFDGQIESSLCERYLPREDRWESCPSMSVGRGGLALVNLGASLYAIGGGWTGYLAFNESYTPGVEAWRALPTPFTGQWRGLGAAVIDSDILAIGGWNGQYLAVTETYSPFPFKIFVPAAQGEGESP